MSVSEPKIRYDRVIETVVLLLMATGTVFVFSAGATLKGDFELNQFYNSTTLKQLVFFPLAVLVIPLLVPRWRAWLLKPAGKSFQGGILLYSGSHCLPLPQGNCYAVPMNALWQ